MALRRMGPMAVIILGGLATSTLLNLFLLPPLYERYGRSSKTPDTARPRTQSAFKLRSLRPRSAAGTHET
jgi:hypothetical protein